VQQILILCQELITERPNTKTVSAVLWTSEKSISFGVVKMFVSITEIFWYRAKTSGFCIYAGKPRDAVRISGELTNWFNITVGNIQGDQHRQMLLYSTLNASLIQCCNSEAGVIINYRK